MTIHWGATTFPGCLRFRHGTIQAKGTKDQDCYFEHPIESWYGVSFFGRLFVGLIKTGGARSVRS
ncbi:hypothetical protein ACVWW6_005534 [Bradyrhizobium sp. USDA 3311]